MASHIVFPSSPLDVDLPDAANQPRFSRLLTTVLGSPFLTTTDLPGDTDSPASYTHPAGTADVAEAEMEVVDGTFATVPRSHTVTRPSSPSPSFRTETYSLINWNADTLHLADYPLGDRTPRCSVGFRSAGRRTVSGYASAYYLDGSPSGSTPLKSSRSLNLGISILPRIWDALREGSPSKKGKRRPGLPWRELESDTSTDLDYDNETLDYMNMQPLDGEEGELVDDEACFIDVRAVTGVDIIALLPPELALHLLSFLDLPAILSCLRVSRTWRRLAQDNAIWRELFAGRKADGWDVDLRRARINSPLSSSRAMLPAPLQVDWHHLYQTRTELDRRWFYESGTSVNMTAAAPSSGEIKDSASWTPAIKKLAGHADSVYCLEFDSRRIITGSRDRTIKVWSIKTGRCLATFSLHRGSVLCLKFDKDWDIGCPDDDESQNGIFKGFMVSGSSDCSVCVWDLYSRPADGGGDGEVKAEVKAILRGHTGGVLDLRIDAKWIVSCSKDALIRVWNRKTLALQCTFRGHEGPVNAVGLQGDRVVSASGDGKMMLWEIGNGERLRTFEGHDRGLACIEFKDDLIVSGSNDCKIKVWSASTGACLRTLVGHDLLVRALSFDPRSGRLVSGSYDKTVKIWDLKTGRMVREFKGCHASHIFDVKFDHHRIVSTSHDQKIVVLDFTEGLDTSLFV